MSNVLNFLILADQQIRIGNYQAALEQLLRALELEPENARAHAGLAACYSQLQRRADANNEIKQALKLDPMDSYVRLVAGTIASSNKEYAEAEDHLTKALELDASDPATYVALAQLYDRPSKRHRVEPMLREGLRQQPDDPMLNAILSAHLLDAVKIDEAEQFATRALEIDAESEIANLVMGRLLLIRGERESARNHAALALRQNPGDPAAVELWCAIELRSNLLIGLWWRSIAPLIRSPNLLRIFWLAYVVVLGQSIRYLLESKFTDFAWKALAVVVAIAVYVILGRMLINRSIKKRLASVNLGDEF